MVYVLHLVDPIGYDLAVCKSVDNYKRSMLKHCICFFH